jgi:23S rRNA pseudouridine1911/1915/1917 synthase
VHIPELEILFEDNHCLVLCKPAGIASAHFAGKDETLDRQVKSYLKDKYQKPGNVFLGVVQRLDQPVSGVLVFARTSKAAARLAAQFRQGSVEKAYLAVVEGRVPPQTGSLEDWLKRDPETGKAEVVAPGASDARQSRLQFARMASHGGLTLVELRPETGRRHQLRVQLAARGQPIFGDVKYGSAHRFGQAIALHARSLSFVHPVRDERLTFEAAVPDSWRIKFAQLLREAGL